MDATDREILRLLQEDGRLSNAALAARVHLSPSPCLRRLKRLEEEGVIERYRAILDRRRVGLDLTVFVEIKVEGHTDETATQLQDTFRAMDEVVACHIVSGPADFLLEVVVPDLEHYERLLMGRLLKMRGVNDVRSNFAIRTVKSNGPLPLRQLAG
jgi:Lrp/AsnC family transcriptional regulator, leucine-responsive regulatory protein